MIKVVFSIGIEAGGTKRVATSIPIVSSSPDVLHRRPVQAVHLLVESLYFYSQPYLQTKHMFFSYFLMHAHDYSAARLPRIEIKNLCEQVDSLNKASVKNIRTETNYRDGCRNPFCIFCFNPAWKYYLDQAHITVYFSPMIRILLPYVEWAASIPYLEVIIAELRCLIMFAPEC